MRLIAISLTLATVFSASALTFSETMGRLCGPQPSLDAETLEARANIETLRADASLPGAEVEFSYEWGLHNIGTKLNAGISQSFDWPGVYTARHKAVKEAEQTLSRIEAAKRRDLSAQIGTLLVDYIAARRNYRALVEIDSILSQMDATLRKGYAGGEVSILDINKLTIARGEFGHELHLAATRVEDLEGEISEVTETDARSILQQLDDDFPVMTIPDEEAYLKSVAERDVDMIANDSEVRQAELAAMIEKRSMYPGFSLGYTYSLEQGDTFNGFSIGLVLPSRANAKRAAAAKLQAQAAAMASIGVTATRRAQYNALVAAAHRYHADIQRLAPVFETTNNIQLLRKAYDGGEISLLTFLQELEYFSRARLSYLFDVAQYNVTLSRLNRYNY